MSNPKTVRVRIAVGVDSSGDWHASGFPEDANPFDRTFEFLEAEPIALFFITADLPIPEVREVEGSVETAG